MTDMRWRRGAVSLGIAVAVAVMALALSFLLIAATGDSPTAAARAMWNGAFGSTRATGTTLMEALPLTLVALAWCVAFTGLRINIGLEGQALFGGACAAIVGLEVHGLPLAIHLPLSVAAGVAGGAFWVGIAAWLWAKRGVSEIISTLMLNFVAIQFVSYLVRGPLQEPAKTFPQTSPIPSSARWPQVLSDTTFTADFFLAILMTALVWLLLRRTPFGFRLRLTGSNEEAADAAGVRTKHIGVKALLISGGLAGLAGASLVLGGQTTVMQDNFTAQRGFNGIAVALLALNRPIACLPAALLFAFLRQGGALMEAQVGVSSSMVLITQAIVILCVAASSVLLWRRRRRKAPATRTEPATEPAPELTGVA